MSLKIKVSYTDDQEAETILSLLDPIMGMFKVKRSSSEAYKNLYLEQKRSKYNGEGGRSH